MQSKKKEYKKRIADGLKELLEIPPEGDIKSMKGYADLYRLRVGTFRILFEINHDEKVIYIQPLEIVVTSINKCQQALKRKVFQIGDPSFLCT
ncbi:type II toxin-antitoxin system RelE/ParE family toxin [Brevibacillus laterosporus]|nr:type II toxin-antitoxin system RelE/ParE family toxin [Brevibacillus laterosporus]MED1667323.1 type II toxin-antitoxin system RelE/ParE family toxin [Brevibacillus laterosporus]MED1717253.1 type II toxin-antitoxin system RelE/ParE family toxin [Brevibacillus laterosporus]